MKKLEQYLPHFLVIIGFIIVSVLYFSPVLSGKVIEQSDIVQYTGMAKEQIDFRKEFKEEPYWTNSAFGGMPTYQLGAKYPHNYIKKLDSIIRFLPRPADYLFLYFIGFYILLVSLRINPLKAFFGALAFGFSTYLIIILGVGHNAKAHAIAYMPMLVAGVILVFRKKYLLGGIITLIAAALEINANHFQMTYYLLLLLLIIGVYYSVNYILKREYKALLIALVIFIGAGILSIGANATGLMATSEYTKFSTRSNSELTYEPTGEAKSSLNAMSYEYITEYSYGIFESLNLFIPRLTGGANSEDVGVKSNVYKFATSINAPPNQAKQFSQHAPTYWGNQPIVAAPAYIGSVVIFLAILALFIEKRRIKYVFLAGAIFSLMLSWGKNFPILTNFFIDYFPLYNKFRAVSSIQVILELCIPVLAIMGLQSIVKNKDIKDNKGLVNTLIITVGLVVLLFIAKGFLSFSGVNDEYYRNAYGEVGPSFIEALTKDRQAMYTSDLIRTITLSAITFGVLWLFLSDKIKTTFAVIAIGVLMVGDLIFVDLNYVNKDNFVNARKMSVPFEQTPADIAISQDNDVFRVFEIQGGLNSARASYFHKSLGGYHAAKPRRIQQLFDYQLASKNNVEILNMLNVKYFIQKNNDNQDAPIKNDNANGNAWFVSELVEVDSPDNEMKALDSFNSKTTAVFNKNAFLNVELSKNYNIDTLSNISLTEYRPNYLKYEASNSNDGLAVFSEVYYPQGWNAYIDGDLVNHLSVNYVLRALQIPAGKHIIEFKFEPEVVKNGSTIALISSILILIVIVGGIGYTFVNNKSKN